MLFTLSDLVLTAFLIWSLVAGWRAGTIKVLSRFAAIFIAYGVARAFSGWLAWLLQSLLPEPSPGTLAGEKLLTLLFLFCDVEGLVARLLGTVAFVIIFLVTLWLVRRLARALTGAFGHGLLGRLNQLLGAVLSLAIALAVILILNDIFFPVLAQMGIAGPQSFLDSSKLVLPALGRLLMLI